MKDIIEILDEAEEIFKRKMASEKYAEYRNNQNAAKILFDDIVRVVMFEHETMRKAGLND